MNGRIIEFREKRSFRRIKKEEVGRHPVRYVSYSAVKVSGIMREIQY